MNVAHLFWEQAARRPDAPALIETRNGRDRVTTYGALAAQSAQVAGGLRAHGVQAGMTALVFAPMSSELYVALAALFRLGVVAMFVDPGAGLRAIARACALRPPDMFLGSPRAHRLLRPLVREVARIPRRFVVGRGATIWGGAVSWNGLLRADTWEAVEDVSADAPALLTFTSGGTGAPKGAVRTHGFLLAQRDVLAENIALREGEIDLATLPIFALANLASGLATVLPDADLRRPGFIAPEPVLRQIARLKPTRAAASPAFYERLLGAEKAKTAFASLTQIYTGGAPVFPRLLDRLQNAAPGARVVAVYGSTEAEPIAHIAQGEITNKDRARMAGGAGLLAGVVAPQIRLRILPASLWGTPIETQDRAALDALACYPDEAGEITVSGPHVLRGYLHGAGDRETKFRVTDGDGETIWHRTGDAGCLDKTGRLWLLGRCDARLVDDRGVLYPFAVECAVLERFPDVGRAALVSHRGARVLLIEWGVAEMGEPLYIPRRRLRATPGEIRDALSWAFIDDVRVWDRLPVDKRHNAKIDYVALRRRLR